MHSGDPDTLVFCMYLPWVKYENVSLPCHIRLIRLATMNVYSGRNSLAQADLHSEGDTGLLRFFPTATTDTVHQPTQLLLH